MRGFIVSLEIAERIEYAADQPDGMQPLRDAARLTAMRDFDLKTVLLPRWMSLFDDLITGRAA